MSDERERTRAIVTLTIVGTYDRAESATWSQAVAQSIARVADEEARRWLDAVTVSLVLETGGAGPELEQ